MRRMERRGVAWTGTATELQRSCNGAATELQQSCNKDWHSKRDEQEARGSCERGRAATELQQSCNRAATELQQGARERPSSCGQAVEPAARKREKQRERERERERGRGRGRERERERGRGREREREREKGLSACSGRKEANESVSKARVSPEQVCSTRRRARAFVLATHRPLYRCPQRHKGGVADTPAGACERVENGAPHAVSSYAHHL